MFSGTFSAITRKEYFYAGQVIAMSLVHGGPPPGFLSSHLFRFITKGSRYCQPLVEDVHSEEVKQFIRDVRRASKAHHRYVVLYCCDVKNMHFCFLLDSN